MQKGRRKNEADEGEECRMGGRRMKEGREKNEGGEGEE